MNGYTVPKIRRATNHHDSNIRKWIHRFNEKGLDGIVSKIQEHKPIKITNDIEKKIVEIATIIQETIMMDYHFQHGHCVCWLEDLLQRR